MVLFRLPVTKGPSEKKKKGRRNFPTCRGKRKSSPSRRLFSLCRETRSRLGGRGEMLLSYQGGIGNRFSGSPDVKYFSSTSRKVLALLLIRGE